jgi:hypothetical protein
MASETAVNYALRAAALATLFEAKVQSNINRSCVGLQLFEKMAADGKNVSWDVATGTAVPTTAAIADGVDVDTFLADTKQQAVLTFAVYHDAFSISGLAEAAARAAGNPAQLADLLGDELSDSLDRLGAAIGYDFYWGTGSSYKFQGLVDTSNGPFTDAGTYAGIARSGAAQWKGNVVDASKGRITVAKVRELVRKINIASGKSPDFYITTPIVFDQLADQLSAQRRFVQEVNLPSRGTIRLDGGYDLVDFDGKPVFKDVRLANTAAADSGVFLACNSSSVRVRYLPHLPAPQILRNAGITVTPEMQMNSAATGLIGKIEELAKTGDKRKLATYIYLTPQVRQPCANGVIQNINELAA